MNKLRVYMDNQEIPYAQLEQDLADLGIDASRAGNTPRRGSLIANAIISMPKTRNNNAYRSKSYKTRGLVRWEQDVETFSHASEGDRNTTTVNLLVRGWSLVLSENLTEDQMLDLYRDAAISNGYYEDEGPSKVESQIQSLKYVVESTHDEELAKGSISQGQGRIPFYTSLVRPSCTPYQLQRYIDEVFESSLPASAKRQLYTAAYIQSHHLEWTHLVMSARATSAAAKIDKGYVGFNWRKAEKFGFIGFNPGVDYATAKELGVDSKSSEITLNLDIYPDLPVENPKVNLNDFKNQASNFVGYIKYQRRFLKDERAAYLQNENMTATKPPELVKPLRPLKAKKPATPTSLPIKLKKPSASLSAGLATPPPTWEERYERDKALGKPLALDRSLEEYTKFIKMMDLF